MDRRDFVDVEARIILPRPNFNFGGHGSHGPQPGEYGRRPHQHVAREPKKGPAKKKTPPKGKGKGKGKKGGSRGGKFNVGGALEAANNAVGIASGVAGMVGYVYLPTSYLFFSFSGSLPTIFRRDFIDLEERDIIDLEARVAPPSYKHRGQNGMNGHKRPIKPGEHGSGIPDRGRVSTLR